RSRLRDEAGNRWTRVSASSHHPTMSRALDARARRLKSRSMIHGAHVVIYSMDAEADRAFFRDVLRFPVEDIGHGWLIFALPPAEVAVHPTDENGSQELFLMCDDVVAFVSEMTEKKIACSRIEEPRWGSVTRLTLPGGGTLGVYQPKHAS